MPNGDKWHVEKQRFNGWQIIAWYYEESSALEHIYELRQEEENR